MDELTIVVNNNINLTATFGMVSDDFDYDSCSNNPQIKQIFEDLQLDCAGRGLFENLSQMYTYPKIKILYDPNLPAMSSFNRSQIAIKWNFYIDQSDIGSSSLYFLHELFHAYQFGVGYIEQTGNTINAEVEAFMSMYKYAIKYNLTGQLPVKAYTYWENSFGAYEDSPTTENYNKMVNFVRESNPIYNEQNFPDIPEKRTISNIQNIFNCY